jgi:hypothetical protein
MSFRSLLVCVLGVALAACAEIPRETVDQVDVDNSGHLFTAATVIEDDWQHLHFLGATRYRIQLHDDQLAIAARGRGSASGLIRRVEIDIERCPEIEWSWSVAVLQPGADLRVKEREDVGASIFLLFGDPGLLVEPMPVPTLRYVWTNDRIDAEQVVDSPYMPGMVRSLVVESGERRRGRWVVHRRNVARDFRRAFGFQPPGPVKAFAIFTDNDQTGEAVEAYYAWARMRCGL